MKVEYLANRRTSSPIERVTFGMQRAVPTGTRVTAIFGVQRSTEFCFQSIYMSAPYSRKSARIIFMLALRPMSQVTKRMFFSLRAQPTKFPAISASLIPHHELIDEEICPAHNAKHFYPAKHGEILADYYQLLVKIGWGTRSTVWLARDITRYVLPFLSSKLQL